MVTRVHPSDSQSTVMLADTLPIVAVEVNGKTFVAGLLWELMPSVKRFAEDAKRLGAQYGADIVAYRIGVGKARQVQAGFAPKRKLDLVPHRLDEGNILLPETSKGKPKKKATKKQNPEGNTFKGMYSWAAAICGIVGDNCLVGLKLGEDLYGIAAQVDGFIIPKSDCIVSREEFLATFTQIYTTGRQGRFARVIAPAEFGIATEELSVRDVLSPKNVTKLYRLKPLNRWDYSKKQVLGAGVGALVTLAVVVGGVALKKQHDAVKRQHDAAQRQMEQARLRHVSALKAAQLEQNNVVPHTWLDQLTPADALAACMDDLRSSPLSAGGWLLTKADCNLYSVAAPGKATLTLTYSRPPGGTDFRTFALYASGKFGVAATPADDHYEKATFAFTKPVMASADTGLKPSAVAVADLVSYFQRVKQTASLTKGPGYTPKPDEKDPPRQDFTAYKLTVTDATATPEDLIAGADPRGLRITDITADVTPDAGQRKWQIEGYLYVH